MRRTMARPGPTGRLGRLVHSDGGAGFTMLEIVVSLLVFAIGASAAAGLFINSMKVSMVAKLDTGAKNIAQQQIESMRDLPYHVDDKVNADGSTTQTPDLIDLYYKNLTTAGTATATSAPAGYVPATAGASYRMSTEPQTGAFYRVVISPVPGFSKYTLYIATQFLSTANAAVNPTTAYTSNSPISTMVGVTITTKWVAGSESKTLRTYTQISEGAPSEALVDASAGVIAYKIVSNLDTRQITDTAGQIDLSGAVTKSVEASANAVSAETFIDTPTDTRGAAPPNAVSAPAAATNYSAGWQSIFDTTLNTTVSTFGQTTVSNLAASAVNQVPNLGSASAPIQTWMGTQGAGSTGMSFSNTATSGYDARLRLSSPLVWTSNVAPVMQTSGYVTTTPNGTGHSVTTNVTAQVAPMHVLGTTFATQGLVVVKLASAQLTCSSNGVAACGTFSYSGTVWWYDPLGCPSSSATPATAPSTIPCETDSTTGLVHYRKVAVTNGASDPLPHQGDDILWSPASGGSAPAAADVVGTDPSGNPLYLGDYIDGLTSLTQSGFTAVVQGDNGGKGVTAVLPELIGVSTQPVRLLSDGLTRDPDSSLGIQLGLLSGRAGDYR